MSAVPEDGQYDTRGSAMPLYEHLGYVKKITPRALQPYLSAQDIVDRGAQRKGWNWSLILGTVGTILLTFVVGAVILVLSFCLGPK